MKKIAYIVGARPQFIKLAPMLKAQPQEWDRIVVHTGQHYDENMSDTFFNDLQIPDPDINLNTGSGERELQIDEIMARLTPVLARETPDLAIVFGDTNSTLAGARAASRTGIPVVHVEAGLRSWNENMPEEINRVETDKLSDLLFAPTQTALKNLVNESLAGKAYLTGDIMVDALENSVHLVKQSKVLQNHNLDLKGYYLLTLHRNYNVDDHNSLIMILNDLSGLDLPVVFPVHPRTKKELSLSNYVMPDQIRTLEPLGYVDFIALESGAGKIITDSGGIQKEAYILKKPCITIRSETEWTETVEEGWNLLLPAGSHNVSEKIIEFKTPEKQNPVFGKDVARTMFDLINISYFN